MFLFLLLRELLVFLILLLDQLLLLLLIFLVPFSVARARRSRGFVWLKIPGVACIRRLRNVVFRTPRVFGTACLLVAPVLRPRNIVLRTTRFGSATFGGWMIWRSRFWPAPLPNL